MVDMNERFSQIISKVPHLFEILQAASPFVEKGAYWQQSKKGVYAFFENGKPVHVGRTRNLRGRLRGHITLSHFSASFAFKCARRELNMHATYKSEGSRSQLMLHDTFGPEFERQIAKIKVMEVRFVEVDDPVAQYLLELYAVLEWDLSLDEFDTH
jgi:hypothetical protein